MEILLKDIGYLVTQDDDRRILRDVDLLVKDGIVEEIGHLNGPADETIDCRGMVVIPGLINTHSHVPMTLLRGVADDMELFPWLREKIWPIEAQLREWHIEAGTELGILEAVRTGTTTLFDMYFYEETIARAFDSLGMRGVLAEALIDFGTPECKPEECLRIADRFVDKWSSHPRITPGYGPHAPYTVSPDNLRAIAERAEERKAVVQIHLSETKGEVKEVREKYGRGPIELAHDSGVLDAKTVAAHVVWPSDREIDILVTTKTLISHNPISNMKLSSGISPVPKMVRSGALVSLGTDGPASNNTLDMFETMKVAALLHKVSMGDPTVMDAQSVLDMATRIPGAWMGKGIGRITRGSAADLVVLDTKVPWWQPLHSVISHLVYSAKSSDVRHVIVDGKILLRDGVFQPIREEEIYRRAMKAAMDLLERSGVSTELNQSD